MAKQEIGLLVSAQEVTPRRGTIQSRITEKYKQAYQVNLVPIFRLAFRISKFNVNVNFVAIFRTLKKTQRH
jgi:hypothetical protein